MRPKNMVVSHQISSKTFFPTVNPVFCPALGKLGSLSYLREFKQLSSETRFYKFLCSCCYTDSSNPKPFFITFF